MLGTNYDNETNIIVGSKSNSSLQNQTGNNQYVDPKIVEDEIALSEHLRKDAEKVKKRDSVNDIVEDFENYSDDGFDNVDKLDNDIVDEVGDDDAMKMLEDEIDKNQSHAKGDLHKVKNIINRLDELKSSGNGKASIEKLPSNKSLSGANNSSGSFSGKTKPIDQQTKFSSSSKVVISKYNKTPSKTNLHDGSLGGSIFA